MAFVNEKHMKRILTILGLLIFCAIIMSPLIMYQYVYPNIGDDTGMTLEVFETIRDTGVAVGARYLAYTLVGYPVVFLSELTGISLPVTYTWFCFICFAASGLVIYFVVSRLTKRLNGWLALVLAFFCAQGLMYLFYYGQIFNIINLAIIFPLLVYFCVRYLQQKKIYQLIVFVILCVLFTGFHTSGIYLPVMAGFATFTYIIYSLVKKKKIQKRAVILGSGIVLLSIIAFIPLVLMPTIVVFEEYADIEDVNLFANLSGFGVYAIDHYVLDIASPSILAVLAISVVYFNETIRKINSKLFLYLLVVATVVLGLTAFTLLSLDPFRQAVDFATMIALVLAGFIGYAVTKKNYLVIIVLIGAIGFGLFHNAPTWFGYNSAMRQVDLKALEYIEDFESFSCSSTIAPWVYIRYTDVSYRNNGGEAVLMRNTPMTPRSTEDNIWYQYHGWHPDNSYVITKKFTDGEIEVEIYEVQDRYK